MQNSLIIDPEGTASRVQPLDGSSNKPFKNQARELFKQHLDANLELHVDEKLTAGKRRFLSTKLVGDAWESVKKQKDLIKHSFKKCGLSKNLDRSEDALINIKNIVGYKMPLPERSSR